MKTLYLDCNMGAAGDMLTAALLELIPNREEFVKKLNNIGLPGIEYIPEPSTKCGILGTHMTVKVYGEEEGSESHEHDGHSHEHHRIKDIEHIVEDHLDIPASVKEDVLKVFSLIAEAESKVHGSPVSEIHFHEVGTMDAVADVTAVCMLIHEIAPERIIASPVNTGSGYVKCAHGILPVPAPATALLLEGIPSYSDGTKTELCTPTGAALLKYFVKEFSERPVMISNAIGYGMGKKDLEKANCVRAFLGETEEKTDVITELMCTVDDMTAEMASFAAQKILEGGAYDVYTVPVSMKKGRTGLLFVALCKPEDQLKIAQIIFKHTTTIGIRRHNLDRFILDRSIEKIDTPYGIIRRKDSKGYGVTRSKYEYDDLSRIADEKGISISDILKELK